MSGDLLDVEALTSLSDRHLTALRGVLRTAGYDAELLARAESVAPRQLDAVRLPLAQAWLRSRPEPAAALARLFAYRDGLQEDEVRRALGPVLTDALTGCGALFESGDGIRSRLRLMPFGGVWVASDEADADADPVMGPGATTAELLAALPAQAPARVLDVGCGAGSLALAAARAGAPAVTAVDLAPRAVAFTRWNARLNALRIDARIGDLLEPVRGEPFDLIVAQPPFVPRPPEQRATTYLHGGARGDELALRLLGELPRALAPAGRALVLMDTAPEAGTQLLQRVRNALPEVALQLSVLSCPGHGRDELAVGYAAAADSTLGPAYAAAARRYAHHLDALGIESVRHVLVAMRVPGSDEPTWAVSVEPRGGRPYRADALARLDAALTLATLSPADLRERRVRPPRGARIVEVHPLDDSAQAELRFVCPGSRAPDQALSDAAAALLELAGRTASVGALIDAYAQSCSDTAATVESAVIDFLRKALVSGLLEADEVTRA